MTTYSNWQRPDDESQRYCSVNLRGAAASGAMINFEEEIPAAPDQYMATGGKGKGKYADRKQMIMKGKGGKGKYADREEMIMTGKGKWTRERYAQRPSAETADAAGFCLCERPCLYVGKTSGCKNGDACHFCHAKHLKRQCDRPGLSVRHQLKDIVDDFLAKGADLRILLALANRRPYLSRLLAQYLAAARPGDSERPTPDIGCHFDGQFHPPPHLPPASATSASWMPQPFPPELNKWGYPKRVDSNGFAEPPDRDLGMEYSLEADENGGFYWRCVLCKLWATKEHLESNKHKQKLLSLTTYPVEACSLLDTTVARLGRRIGLMEEQLEVLSDVAAKLGEDLKTNTERIAALENFVIEAFSLLLF